ncbi:hypothetical protein LTR05_008583 [Lithohypha guttulata]|uniref:FAD-binding FR-type domain-containing protein n=1 Tax=Lithohypha guttulata TaxID=1690604 RepID=A0AAN7ST75_9EURO|nr:hypothetical protein LTR05_008583 [Lithohypha guttulata]
MLSVSSLDIYAAVLAAMLLVLFMHNTISVILSELEWQRLSSFTAVLSRNIFEERHWPSWTWWSLVRQVFLLTGNVLLVFVGMTDIKDAAREAGTLAMLNMAFFYLSPHLSYLGDLLGLSLDTVKTLHRMMVLPFLLLTVFHLVVLHPAQNVFAKPFSKELYGVIASLAVAVLLLSGFRPLRRRFYEAFLRAHQVLAGLILCMVWMHIRDTTNKRAQYTAIVTAGVFGSLGLGQIVWILLSNKLFARGFPRARTVAIANVLHMTVESPIKLKVHPGQYINLCLPGVSISSFLQSHPFIVVSARHCDDKTVLELVIEAKRGWTSRLLAQPDYAPHALDGETAPRQQSFRCIFSGPHGPRHVLDDYGVVVLVASGLGAVGLLPYLEYLLQGHSNSTVKAGRIHLVWQLRHPGKWSVVSFYNASAEPSLEDGRPVSDLLDHALDADAVDSGYVRAHRHHRTQTPRLTAADHESVDLPLVWRESTSAGATSDLLPRLG